MYARYVAIGDSTSEGLDDPYPDGRGYRGWADRLAERLATLNPDVRYANLAVRGRRAGPIRAEQLAPAIALEPDLATVVAGLNDVLRRGCSVDAVVDDVEAMFAALRRTGATVLTFTMPDLSAVMPLARFAQPRLAAYNAGLREAAARTGAVLVDFEHTAAAADPRLWSEDRLHANSEGHARIAEALGEGLGLPGARATWTQPLAPMPATPSRVEAVAAELRWARRHFLPHVVRHARGRSSGDGIVAKQPAMQPVLADAPAGG